MLRYFFNIEGVDNLPMDVTGEELPNDEAALADAAIQIREILSEARHADWNIAEWRMVVTADDGRKVLDLSIEASLALSRGSE